MAPVLDPKRTAIVFIEFQNEFCDEAGKNYGLVSSCMASNDTLKNGHALLEAARKVEGLTIIHVPVGFSSDFREIGADFGILAGIKAGAAFVEGSHGHQFFKPMEPRPEELVIKGKHGLCAFASTDLDFVLRQRRIENVGLCGFLSNCCVESTMRTAYEKGYRVFTVTDACATVSQEAHDASVKFTYPMFSTPLLHSDLLGKLAA